LDLQNYKRKLKNSYASVGRQDLHIALMKAMFHWAKTNDVLESILNINAISKDIVVHKEMLHFQSTANSKIVISFECENEGYDMAGFELWIRAYRLQQAEMRRP
jgi:hypothetical protein